MAIPEFWHVHVLGRVMALMLVAGVADARVWHVKPDGTGDTSTIGAALNSATAGDSVMLAPGTYSWTSESASGESMLVMKRGVNLVSSSGAASTVVDAEYCGRAIRCHDVGVITIRGLTITRGNLRIAPPPNGFGGGIYSTGDSRISVRNCILRGNAVHNGNRGGAMACADEGSTVADTEVHDNFGAYDSAGGGLYMEHGAVLRCRIVGNTVSGDGGDGGGAMMNDGRIEDCWIERNSARGFSGASGGGVVMSGGSVSRTMFVENSAAGYGYGPGAGGALYASSPVTIDGCRFIANEVIGTEFPARGGAIAGSSTAAVTVSRSTFLENRAAATGNVATPVAIAALWLPAGGSVASCIIAESQGPACDGSAVFSCNDTYPTSVHQPTCGSSTNGNFSLDPLFCAADPIGSRNLPIAETSPCAPGHHPAGLACGVIGAGTVGCNPTAVVHRPWGGVKQLLGR